MAIKYRRKVDKPIEEEDKKDSPIPQLLAGAVFIGLAILYLVDYSELTDDKGNHSGKRSNLFVLILRTLNSLGGKWLVLGILLTIGGFLIYLGVQTIRDNRKTTK